MFKLVLSLFILLNVSYNVYSMSLYRMDVSDGADDLYSITVGSDNQTGQYSVGDNITIVCKYKQVFGASEYRFKVSYCDTSFMCRDIYESQRSGDHIVNSAYLISPAFYSFGVQTINAPALFNITIDNSTKDSAGGYKCLLDYVDPITNVTRFTPTLYAPLNLEN